MFPESEKLHIPQSRDETITSFSNSIIDNDTLVKLKASLENGIFGQRHKFQDKSDGALKNLIKKFKINRLTNNFIKKLRLNSTLREPYSYQKQFQKQKLNSNGLFTQILKYSNPIFQSNGIQMPNLGSIIWTTINFIQTAIMVFIFSILVAFPQTIIYEVFKLFKIFSIILYFFDLIYNLVFKRFQQGKHLQKIGEITKFYIKNQFILDLLSVLVLIFDLTFESSLEVVGLGITIIKMAHKVKRIQKFDYILLTNSQKEHYYGLIKIFITNFVIAHFLSICLNLMADLNPDHNWLSLKDIQNSQWYVKYIWGYYWGTNIMLTVGFGDITAVNCDEAIVLVFIETVSCITLAYNVSSVGNLIGSIRENQESKKKKIKIFHRMCKQNFVSAQLQSKVSNFIQQSHHIKQQFELDIQDEVMQYLPLNIQREYRKEANKSLFDSLGFMSYLSKTSLINLAEEVHKKICHPEEIVLKKGFICDFVILQKGFLSLTCRVPGLLDGKQIETLQVISGSKPRILSLDFLTNQVLNYNVKSNTYSVLYYLSREQFMSSLRASDMDYQLFCMLKDRGSHSISDSKIYECSVCKTEFHNKFQCTRLHYIPVKQNVINKYLYKSHRVKQKRQLYERNKMGFCSLHLAKELKEEQKRYIQTHYDSQHYQQIEKLANFYAEMDTNEMQLGKQIATENKIFTERNFQRITQILAKIQYECGFWLLDSDIAQNFNFYFQEGNPDLLKKSTRRQKRKIVFSISR